MLISLGLKCLNVILFGWYFNIPDFKCNIFIFPVSGMVFTNKVFHLIVVLQTSRLWKEENCYHQGCDFPNLSKLTCSTLYSYKCWLNYRFIHSSSDLTPNSFFLTFELLYQVFRCLLPSILLLNNHFICLLIYPPYALIFIGSIN